MEKKQNFNIGKLIALLSCFGLLVAMVLGVALTKPVKAYAASDYATINISKLILTTDKPTSSGTYYFAEGEHTGSAFSYDEVVANKIHSISFMDAARGGTVNLLDLVKSGKLRYGVTYTVDVQIGDYPSTKVFTIPHPNDIFFSNETLSTNNNITSKYYFYEGITTDPGTIRRNAVYSSGYSSSASGGTQNVREMIVAGNLKFNTVYSVVSSYGESSDTKYSNVLQVQVVEEVIPLPAEPTKEGHTFKGWYFDEYYLYG